MLANDGRGGSDGVLANGVGGQADRESMDHKPAHRVAAHGVHRNSSTSQWFA